MIAMDVMTNYHMGFFDYFQNYPLPEHYDENNPDDAEYVQGYNDAKRWDNEYL